MSLKFKNENSQKMFNDKKYFDENIRSLTLRQIRWMQKYLASSKNTSFLSMGSNDPYEELIYQLSRQEDFKNLVTDAYLKMSYNLVPEQHFAWLINNLRGQIFTLNVLFKDNNYDYFDKNINNLMNGIYQFFDNKENKDNVESKILFLNDIEKRWFIVFNNENYSNWLSESDKDHIKWVKDYLLKAGVCNNLIHDGASHKDIRSHVLASLDIIDYPVSNLGINNFINFKSSDRKEIIIDKMKRAWSQQKYRDAGKTKKAYHLPLTKQTHNRLEKMAKIKGLSQTAMLDILINSEYQLRFLDRDGNELY